MAFQGKATFSDGFAVAPDGCRLAYHLDGNAASPDKVRNAKSGPDFALSTDHNTKSGPDFALSFPPHVVLLLQKRQISLVTGFYARCANWYCSCLSLRFGNGYTMHTWHRVWNCRFCWSWDLHVVETTGNRKCLVLFASLICPCRSIHQICMFTLRVRHSHLYVSGVFLFRCAPSTTGVWDWVSSPLCLLFFTLEILWTKEK